MKSIIRNKIKVLILTNMYPDFMGGMFIHNQVKYIMNTGCKVKVIVPVPYVPRVLRYRDRWKTYASIPERDTIDMVSVCYPRYLRLPGIWFHSLACYFQYWGINDVIRALINEFKPDLLHAHAATVPGYLGLMLKKRYNLPLVCSLRGSDINVYPFYGKLSMYLTKKLISEADQILSVSSALKETAIGIEKPKRKIEVIHNGVEINTFFLRSEERNQIRGRLAISEKDKVVIFIGSISRDKGIYELINVFIRLNLWMSNLHLIIIGAGPESLKIQAIVESQREGGKVHIVGEKPHNEIPMYLNASDIFVLPSYSEGLPNVILEAMSCSLPVVATRVGGIPEAVEEGKSGILIEKRDIDSLKEAIEYLIRNDHVAKKMGNRGRKIIEEKFSWSRNAEEVIRVYRNVMNGKNVL